MDKSEEQSNWLLLTTHSGCRKISKLHYHHPDNNRSEEKRLLIETLCLDFLPSHLESHTLSFPESEPVFMQHILQLAPIFAGVVNCKGKIT